MHEWLTHSQSADAESSELSDPRAPFSYEAEDGCWGAGLMRVVAERSRENMLFFPDKTHVGHRMVLKVLCGCRASAPGGSRRSKGSYFLTLSVQGLGSAGEK